MVKLQENAYVFGKTKCQLMTDYKLTNPALNMLNERKIEKDCVWQTIEPDPEHWIDFEVRR